MTNQRPNESTNDIATSGVTVSALCMQTYKVKIKTHLALLARHFFRIVLLIFRSLPSDVVDFSSLASCKHSINSVDFSKYLVD